MNHIWVYKSAIDFK